MKGYQFLENNPSTRPPALLRVVLSKRTLRLHSVFVLSSNDGRSASKDNFFELCETRKVRRIPMLLYIYLRGLYGRFQKPNFFWNDSTLRKQLGISTNTLTSAKKYLQERGLIKYSSGTGRTPTQYSMLGTALLPELKVSKFDTLGVRFKARQGLKNRHPIYTSKERLKKKVGNIFQGMSDKDKEFLRKKELL